MLRALLLPLAAALIGCHAASSPGSTPTDGPPHEILHSNGAPVKLASWDPDSPVPLLGMEVNGGRLVVAHLGVTDDGTVSTASGAPFFVFGYDPGDEAGLTVVFDGAIAPGLWTPTFQNGAPPLVMVRTEGVWRNAVEFVYDGDALMFQAPVDHAVAWIPGTSRPTYDDQLDHLTISWSVEAPPLLVPFTNIAGDMTFIGELSVGADGDVYPPSPDPAYIWRF